MGFTRDDECESPSTGLNVDEYGYECEARLFCGVLRSAAFGARRGQAGAAVGNTEDHPRPDDDLSIASGIDYAARS